MSNPSYTNKLIHEKSPYLLSYAHTPVNWFPWGEEAFKLAGELDKPIFLSIGHSTSRLCKVMLEENFRDSETAALMNQHFVNIKVDKEEYPHLATLYLEFANMLSCEGEQSLTSWPLNIFLTPELIPFFSISHFIMEERFCKGALKQLMVRIDEIWNHPEEKEEILEQAEKIFQVISFVESCVSKDELNPDDIQHVVTLTYKDADPMYGGLKSFPKVTGGNQGRFLLKFSREHNDCRALFYVDRTLNMMSLGGIRDHLGGGFYRYAIDDKWLIPCFEKTLMDNAMLALLYLETWAFINKECYREVGVQILNYLSNFLRDPREHCYFLSEDGGSLGAKGGEFYTWSGDEIREILNKNADIFCEYYGICREGITNGRNILHIPHNIDIETVAEKYHYSTEEVETILKDSKALLFERRQLREKPFVDDQAITYCNGFMIHALTQAGLLLGETSYFDEAEKTAEFIKRHMIKDGLLMRRWREGESKFNAYLEDYSCVILGFLSLFEVGRGIHWLESAVSLVKTVISRFKSESGLFYSTESNDPGMIIKRWEIADRDGISGTGILAECFLSLYAITGKREFLKEAEDIFHASKPFLDANPFACFSQLSAFQRYYAEDNMALHVCLGNLEDREKVLEGFRRNYLPNKSLIWLLPGENQDTSILDGEDIHKMTVISAGKTTIYSIDANVCRKFSDINSFIKFIN